MSEALDVALSEPGVGERKGKPWRWSPVGSQSPVDQVSTGGSLAARQEKSNDD